MDRQTVEQQAYQDISSGFNCAESVLRSAGASLGVNADGSLTRAATCFGGGVGRSKQELCGALAGGLMALGLARGRDSAGQSSDLPSDLAAEFRERFIDMHGSSSCKKLLEGFGPQPGWEGCKRLTAQTAGLLFDLSREAGLNGEK